MRALRVKAVADTADITVRTLHHYDRIGLLKPEAQALEKRFAAQGLDRIYCSPLGRAIDTARHPSELLGIDYNIEHWTKELWLDCRLSPAGSLRTSADCSPRMCQCAPALARSQREHHDGWRRIRHATSLDV